MSKTITGDFPQKQQSQNILIARLIVGLIQGLALYIVSEFVYDRNLIGQFSQTSAFQFSRRSGYEVGQILSWLLPLPILFGLGVLRTKTLIAWAIGAFIALFLFSWLGSAVIWDENTRLLAVWFHSLIVIYIVHEFIVAAQQDDRRIGRYETFFENSWNHAFQVVLSLGFLLAYWIVIFLGTALFEMIGLKIVEDFVFSDEFRFVSSAIVFALGIHITETRIRLTTGARQIGLMLLSILSVLMTIILTTFLLSLFFTGLTPLWETGHATSLMLTTGAAMILLINAAYQSGREPNNGFMRNVIRISTFPLLGTVILATIGLWLRVDQYGFTPARVVAGIELGIISFYAIAYVFTALKPGPWMEFLKSANIAGAALVAVLLAFLMTPVLDPARISINNQIARLNKGNIEPDDFDFAFLNDARTGFWGKPALKQLQARSGSPRDNQIAFLAKNPPEKNRRTGLRNSLNDRKNALYLFGEGTIPDAAYLPLEHGHDPVIECVKTNPINQNANEKEDKPPYANKCTARLIDIDFDGDLDLVVNKGTLYIDTFRLFDFFVLRQASGQEWSFAGRASIVASRYGADNAEYFSGLDSDDSLAAFENMSIVPTRIQDLSIGGIRFQFLQGVYKNSSSARRSKLQVIDERPAPEFVYRDTPGNRFFRNCGSSQDKLPICYGLYRDLNKDGIDDYILLSFGKGSKRVRVMVDAYLKEDVHWSYLGFQEKLLPVGLQFETKEDQLAVLEDIIAIPPKFGKLELNGRRFIIEYGATTKN